MRRWLTLLALACTGPFLWLPTASTSAASSQMPLEDELLRDATLVIQRVVSRSAAIPASTFATAHGIVAIPAAMRDGHQYYGLGVLSARRTRSPKWTPPAVIAFEGSIPLNLDSGIAEFVLVAQTARGLERLTQERFMSPVILPILPGPLGQGTATQGDLIAYIQAGDCFAGVTVTDWMIAEMRSSHALVYGKPYSTAEVLRGEAFLPLPPAAQSWLDALTGAFGDES